MLLLITKGRLKLSCQTGDNRDIGGDASIHTTGSVRYLTLDRMDWSRTCVVLSLPNIIYMLGGAEGFVPGILCAQQRGIPQIQFPSN